MVITRRGFVASLLALPVAWKLRGFIPETVKPASQRFYLALESIRNVLPSGISLYEINGQTIFPMFGDSTVLTSVAAWFVDQENHLASGVKFNYWDDQKTVNSKIVKALSNFQSVNFDGGELPKAA